MERSSERIEWQIDRERAELRSNLVELENRVKSAVDWRRYFESNPPLWIGVAFGSGLLLALTASRRAYTPERETYMRLGGSPRMSSSLEHSDHRRRALSRAWGTIESALIGMAAAKLKDTLAQVLPGFREQLARREGDGYAHDDDGYAHDPSAQFYRQH
jgi:hypothetical protein